MKKYAAVAAIAAAVVGVSGCANATIGHAYGQAISEQSVQKVVGHVYGPPVTDLAESGDLP